jgi:DNA-binding GntR family transcriptional regulator
MATTSLTPSRADNSMATRAYQEIKRQIVDGSISPGYPLLETELAAQLGISRTPIREALVRLKHEKLAVSLGRKGMFASSLSASDMEEIYEMLEGLESMAVKLAAERATDEDVRRLEEAVAAQKDALTRDDLPAWISADEAFHGIILEAAHNRQILEVVTKVNDQLRRVRRLTIRARRHLDASTEMHEATFKAIRNRNGDLARDLNQRHRADAREEMVAILRSF